MSAQRDVTSSSTYMKELRERLQVTEVIASSHNEPDFSLPAPCEDQPVCWICLDHATPTQPLIQPCRCPRQAHPTCVARWQLQSAGTRKETHCEFCDGDLPDWKKTLTPQCGANAPAIMNVNFNERTFSFEVKPGIQGYRDFTASIRQAFGLPEDSELNITFTCDEPIANQNDGMPSLDSSPFIDPAAPPTPIPRPGTPRPAPMTPPRTFDTEMNTPPSTPTSASLLTLQGAGAYDAAVHCASVSAAKRMSQGGSSSPSPSRSPFSPSTPSILSRQPFSNIPGYNIALPPQNFRERPHLMQPPHLTAGRTLVGPPFRGLTNLPNMDEPRMASVPRRNSTQNMLQRASKAVRKFTGRKDRD